MDIRDIMDNRDIEVFQRYKTYKGSAGLSWISRDITVIKEIKGRQYIKDINDIIQYIDGISKITGY